MAAAPLLTARQFLILLAVYFGMHVLIRTLLSHSADLDESDQLVLTQKASWGYGPQPPLYTWIQMGFFAVFGTSIFSLALLKNLLLLGTGVLAFLNARLITRDRVCGMAAAASLFFIPQFAWESQRDLTHSVLASAVTMATVFAFLRLYQSKRLRDYLWFGLCAGLGIISKYNYALFLAALLMTAACRRESRAILLNARILVSAAVFVLCFLPNALWILGHQDQAFRTASKLLGKTPAPAITAITSGLSSLAVSTITFLGPFVLLAALLLWKRAEPFRIRFQSEQIRFAVQLLVTCYAILVLSVLVFHVDDIRERYLQPVLIYFPILAFALFQDRLDPLRFKRIIIGAGIVMAIVTICIPGRILLAERLHRTEPLNKPYDALAHQIIGSLGDTTAVIADTELLAGNLRLNIPGKTFATPEFAPLFTKPRERMAFVWDATRRAAPPERLAHFAEESGLLLNETQARFYEAIFKYHRTRQMRIGVIIPGNR